MFQNPPDAKYILFFVPPGGSRGGRGLIDCEIAAVGHGMLWAGRCFAFEFSLRLCIFVVARCASLALPSAAFPESADVVYRRIATSPDGDAESDDEAEGDLGREEPAQSAPTTHHMLDNRKNPWCAWTCAVQN